MKYATSLGVAALVSLVASQPHHHHKRMHAKREVHTTVVTVQQPNAVVYVNDAGVSYTTVYDTAPTPLGLLAENQPGVAVPAPTPASFAEGSAGEGSHPPAGNGNGVNEAISYAGIIIPSKSASASSAQVTNAAVPSPDGAAAAVPAPSAATDAASAAAPAAAPAAVPAAAPVPAPAPAPVAAAPASPPPPPPPAPVAAAAKPGPPTGSQFASDIAGLTAGQGYGIGWTPFSGAPPNVRCKTQDQVNADFKLIKSHQFTKVRLYGPSCDQVLLGLNAAKATGLRVMLGIFELGNTNGEIKDIIRQVNAAGAPWDLIEAIAVGNEDVHKGAAVELVFDSVAKARAGFGATPYRGPIVHVDTMGAILKDQRLCSKAAGDYITANIHPYFNPITSADAAGRFVSQQVGALRACYVSQNRDGSPARVVVTETGWPTAGDPNQSAIPGKAQQIAAVKSILQSNPTETYLYSAFNNLWLQNNPSTFNTEHYWGVLQ